MLHVADKKKQTIQYSKAAVVSNHFMWLTFWDVYEVNKPVAFSVIKAWKFSVVDFCETSK